jgi:GNAT superfamily N-acetyltransferase
MIIAKAEVIAFLRPLLGGESGAKLMVLFGGDRLSCCDEAVAIKSGDHIVGIATISPNGEDGSSRPTIVGVFVLPQFRGQGLGRQLMMEAIQHCLDRGFESIRLDVLSVAMRHIVRSLSGEIRSKLVVIDHGNILDLFPG